MTCSSVGAVPEDPSVPSLMLKVSSLMLFLTPEPVIQFEQFFKLLFSFHKTSSRAFCSRRTIIPQLPSSPKTLRPPI